MKKSILLFGIILLTASNAYARAPFRHSEPRNGLYVGVRGGADAFKMHIPWKEKDDKDKMKASFAMAAAVGVRLRYIRLEAEYMLMNKQKSTNSYEQNLDTIMAQAYFELPFTSPLRPFVNVGAGVYTMDYKRKDKWSDDDTSFAWSAGGGFAWNVSDATSLDLGYRYLKIDDLKTPDGTVRQDNHIIYLGWRHVF